MFPGGKHRAGPTQRAQLEWCLLLLWASLIASGARSASGIPNAYQTTARWKTNCLPSAGAQIAHQEKPLVSYCALAKLFNYSDCLSQIVPRVFLCLPARPTLRTHAFFVAQRRPLSPSFQAQTSASLAHNKRQHALLVLRAILSSPSPFPLSLFGSPRSARLQPLFCNSRFAYK